MPKYKVDIRRHGIQNAYTQADNERKALWNVLSRSFPDRMPKVIGGMVKSLLADERLYSVEEAPGPSPTADAEQLDLFAAIQAAMDVSDGAGTLVNYTPYETRWPQLQPNKPKGGEHKHPEFYREPLTQDSDYDGGVMTIGTLISDVKQALEIK